MTGVSLFSIGAGITTLVGVLAFAVACATFIYSRRITSKRKELLALPEASRPSAVDQLASLYGLSLEDSHSEAKKFELVAHRMQIKANSSRFFGLLGAIGFVACFAMLIYQP